MNKILALWATPRSTSTAFERVMSQRGDLTCFHEPYNEAFYYGFDRRNNRYFIANPDLPESPHLTINSVHQNLLQQATNGRVFVKDFAYSIMHKADRNFLDSFNHSFLIRDPEKVLTSMHSRWPDITLAEVGFEDLHTLFNRVADRTGVMPVVIDSDELMSSPTAGMSAYCEAMGFEFIKQAMSWSAQGENTSNPTWNTDEHGFHDQLKASTGLQKQARSYPALETSPEMMRLHQSCRPHYDALFAHRLKF